MELSFKPFLNATAKAKGTKIRNIVLRLFLLSIICESNKTASHRVWLKISKRGRMERRLDGGDTNWTLFRCPQATAIKFIREICSQQQQTYLDNGSCLKDKENISYEDNTVVTSLNIKRSQKKPKQRWKKLKTNFGSIKATTKGSEKVKVASRFLFRFSRISKEWKKALQCLETLFSTFLLIFCFVLLFKK